MPKLITQQNRFDYRGLFTKPLFSLFGEGRKIVEGLYDTFSPYGVGLADIHNDSISLSPSDQIVAVNFSAGASYKFKFDSIEASVLNFTVQDLSHIQKFLRDGDNWLRSADPGLAFQSHLFATFSHNRLSAGNSQDFLCSLSQANTPDIGVALGNGIIYHWNVPDKEWRVQLTIDHSVNVSEGLFVHFILIAIKHKIDFVEMVEGGVALYKTAMAQIGLEIE
jgi:hypothetical protein